MQEYRSGHNEAVLKTVWVKAHGGSNPSSCATQREGKEPSFFAWRRKRVKRKPELTGVRASEQKRKRKKRGKSFFESDTLALANIPLPAPKKKEREHPFFFNSYFKSIPSSIPSYI